MLRWFALRERIGNLPLNLFCLNRRRLECCQLLWLNTVGDAPLNLVGMCRGQITLTGVRTAILTEIKPARV